MTPAPPPPVGAPEPVLGAWALLSQKWARETQARETLALLNEMSCSHGTIKHAEEDLAFALNETNNAHELYLMELYDAYAYPEDYTRTERAS